MEATIVNAVVEFAAVVIGILVALWANNWNEIRKDRLLERNYLRSLRDDIDADRTALKQYIDFADGTASAAASLLRIVRGQDTTPAPREAILRQLKRAGMMYPFQPTSTTFQELSGGGGLRLITDRAILRQAIDYYAGATLPSELVALAIRRIWHEYYDALVAVLDPVLVPTISLDVFHMLRNTTATLPQSDEAIPLPDLGISSSATTVEAIRGNQQLERALALVLDSSIVVRESMTDLLGTADRLAAALHGSIAGSKQLASASLGKEEA